MNDRLDQLVERLAALPMDRSLAGFEAEVARGTVRRRAEARALSALAPVRVFAVAMALVIGVAAGSLSVAASVAAPGADALFAAADLAPSTLLDRSR